MPLLSDDQLSGIPDTPEPDTHARDGADWLNWWGARQDAVPMTGRAVRDFYEGLITSGELRVVKEVKHEAEIEWRELKGYTMRVACGDFRATINVRHVHHRVICPNCGNVVLPL